MVIHWAGENSPVIVALTRDPAPTTGSTSKLFISRNYGDTFENVYRSVMINASTNSTLEIYYNSPVFNSHVRALQWSNLYYYLALYTFHVVLSILYSDKISSWEIFGSITPPVTLFCHFVYLYAVVVFRNGSKGLLKKVQNYRLHFVRIQLHYRSKSD